MGKSGQLHRSGHRHQLLGEWEQARRCYEQALLCDPGHAATRLALAQLRMMQSGFDEGRELYEARFDARGGEGGFDWRHLPIPRWRGEKLQGKHLYLWAEQGFGDVIMYAAFLPHLLAQRPSRITLGMFPKMMTLFARSFPHIQVESLENATAHAMACNIVESFPQVLALARQNGLALDLEPMRRDYEQARARGVFDYAAPMGDAMVHGLLDFIPSARQLSFLTADAGRVAGMREKLSRLGAGRRIGISWYSGNLESGGMRSIPLSQWLPLLRLPGCHFISLQHHVPTPEIERFCADHACRIATDMVPDPVQDTEGLAALIACMDEVITIDNSNAHLAGALGVPVTLLLPKGCDFRWPVRIGSDDTLWYRSVTAVRQEKPMEWRPVIERVTANLRQRLN